MHYIGGGTEKGEKTGIHGKVGVKRKHLVGFSSASVFLARKREAVCVYVYILFIIRNLLLPPQGRHASTPRKEK